MPISSIMSEYGAAFSELQPFMEPPGCVSGFDIRKETPEGKLLITFHLEEPFDLLDDQERIVRTTRDVWKEDALRDMRAVKRQEFLVMKVEPALPADFVSISSIIDSHGVAFSELRPSESPPGVLSWFTLWKSMPNGDHTLSFRLQEPFELLDMDGKAIKTIRDVWKEETLRKMRAVKSDETILREFPPE